jgi:misacylated tRNA(Ala) deacylase
MTHELFREDAYRHEFEARVAAAADGTVVLEATVFYPEGGGQPGDTGRLHWPGGEAEIVDTRRGEGGRILHVLADSAVPPPPGVVVFGVIDWERRHRLMRMHTSLHLLSAVLPFPVTGGQVSDGVGRLDFDLPEVPDKADVEARLNELIAADHEVAPRWIDEAELDARPDLVRTLSVQPPRGAGRIRLIDIAGVDLQPCGGTHVRHTGEIGPVRVQKIEKKGRLNRRVKLVFA